MEQHYQRTPGGAVIDLSVSLDVTPQVVRFERIAGRFTDFRPVMGGRVDVAARRLVRRMFLTQGRAGGRGQWPKLTDRYVRAQRVFPDRPILRQTDDLFDALTVRGHPNQELVLEKDRYSLSVAEGAGKVRARFVGHQLGVPESKVPVRQMIPDPLPKTFIAEIRKAVMSYIVRGTR